MGGLMLVWALTAALGADLLLAEPTGLRRYKLEAYGWGPVPGNRWNLDWAETSLEYWSGLLACERSAPRVDTCTFEGGFVEHGYRIKGEDALRVFAVTAPERVAITWSKAGVPSADFQGDVHGFQRDASNALIPLLRGAEGKVFAPDSQRELGGAMEHSLRLWLLGALELPLPKKGTTKDGYDAKAPGLAQTWVGGAYGGNVDMTVTPLEGTVVQVSGVGRFGESNPISWEQSVKGDLELDGVFDTSTGAALATKTRVHFEAHYTGYYGDRLSLMNVALPDHTWHGGELPGAPIPPTKPPLGAP